MTGVDYYEVLSVTPDVTVDELKSRYRRLSLTHHPDRGGSTEQMTRLNEAYRTLSNPLLRKDYDQKLARFRQASAHGTDYHYTYAAPVRRAAETTAEQSPANFWRRFIVLAIFGVAFLAYDIMTVIVLPSMVKETPRATSTIPTPTESGDLSDEANSALSEMQQVGRPPASN